MSSGGASVRKVKLIFGESKLVIPVAKGTDQVSSLIQDINKRLQVYLGDPTIRIKELSTADGFILNPNDVINQVISDEWMLSGSDYQKWIKEQLALCSTTWYTLTTSDYVDDARVFISVGKHKHNKIFISFGKWENRAEKVTRLELFDAADLESFGKGGKPLIARETVKDKKSGADRFQEACFVVEKGSVVAVELVSKMTSDFRPQIERVAFTMDPLDRVGETKETAAKVIQSSDRPKPSKPYKLPAKESKGKSLNEIPGVKLVDKGSNAPEPTRKKDAVGSGSSVIQLKQKDEPQADQSWYSENTKSFDQYVYNNITFMNNTEKSVIINKVSAEYQTADGKTWKACNNISLGNKSGMWHYSWGYYDTTNFTFGPKQVVDVAVRTGIEVPFINTDKNRRIHHSLPNPIKIRVTIEDADGGKSSIETEYVNGPMEVDTFESKKKSVGESDEKKFMWFASCDDVDSENRVAAWIAVEQSSQWGPIVQFAHNLSSSQKYLYAHDFKKLAWKASKDNKEEMPIDDASYADEKKGNAVTVTAMIDQKEGYVYALKIALKTPSSTHLEYYPL